MAREIYCQFLKAQAEGLDYVPWPGELGQRIYQNICAQAWQQWQQHQVMLINEYQLNTMDETAVKLLEDHLRGYLFAEGEYVGVLPGGYTPAEE